MNDYRHFLKSEFAGLGLTEILSADPRALLGVTEEIAEALLGLGIHSIFDLATSRIFSNAREIAEAGNENGSAAAKYGFPAADMVDADLRNTPIADLAGNPPEDLEGIGQATAENLKRLVETQTIRDLAFWPPFQAARTLLNMAFGFEDVSEDPDAPADLLPRTGDFPVEKVNYRKIFLAGLPSEEPELKLPRNLNLRKASGSLRAMLTMPAGDDDDVTSEGSESEIREEVLGRIADLVDGQFSGQVDLTSLQDNPHGFTVPAFGALMTFEQAWYSTGVSLGQLLHSLALAPGESTKIAMIDWSSTASTMSDESVSQAEKLTAGTSQTRSINEVTSGVMNELQEGSSVVSSRSWAANAGASTGGITESLFGSAGGGASMNKSRAVSVSSSSGRRDVTGEMLQKITGSTQQHASSARNRRASIVTEVSQHESEQVKTRIVTNYNHSHALSVHYYEVVQIYRVIHRLKNLERCIFIPMKILDFSHQRLIERYQRVLAAAALNEATFQLLMNSAGRVQLQLNPFMGDGARLVYLGADQLLTQIEMSDPRWGDYSIIIKMTDATEITLSGGGRMQAELMPFIQVGLIESITLDYNAVFDFGPGVRTLNDDIAPMPLKLHLRTTRSQGDGNEMGDEQSVELPVILPVVKRDEMTPAEIKRRQVVGRLFPGRDTSLLGDLLNREALYYSQAIWRSLEPAEIAMLLANYHHDDRRIIEYIEPTPLATYGNYLVFRYGLGEDADEHADQAFEAWKRKHADFARVSEDTVSVPTGGVFAEAILGRYNSSEKLDITRFWDWQSSPIPHQAPDIAPVQTGNHDRVSAPRPGGLDAPMINMQAPQPLPDPAGMTALLNSLANSGAFRDMSGLAQSGALAQSGVNNAARAALSAQAMESMLQGQRLQVMSALARGAQDARSSGVGAHNPSYSGGMLNYVRKHGASDSARTAAHNLMHENMMRRAGGHPYPELAEEWSRVMSGSGLAGLGNDVMPAPVNSDSANEFGEDDTSEEDYAQPATRELGRPLSELNCEETDIQVMRSTNVGDVPVPLQPAVNKVDYWDPSTPQTPPSMDPQLENILQQTMQDPRFKTFGYRKINFWQPGSKDDSIHVAIVDRTGGGNRFAGHRYTENLLGASLIKVPIFYAYMQLMADVNRLITSVPGPKPGRIEEAQALLESQWGLQSNHAPRLADLYKLNGTSLVMNKKMWNVWHSNTPSIWSKEDIFPALVNGIGYHYFNCLMLKSGLFSEEANGIWIRYMHKKLNPYEPAVAHLQKNQITALSTAHLFTLLSDERLIRPSSSKKMMNLLNEGCLGLGQEHHLEHYKLFAKCGIVKRYHHTAFRYGDGKFDFILVVLSKTRYFKGYFGHKFFVPLVEHLVEEIRALHP